jgi:hypothetical protein
MAHSLTWKQFFVPTEQGSGSIQCAAARKADGKVCGLLRLGAQSDLTLLMNGDKPIQAIHCSTTGCETAQELKPIAGSHNTYRLRIEANEKAKGRVVELSINPITENQLDVTIKGISKQPSVLRYYGDRGIVTFGESAPSLMRGGSKIRVGRSFGYGMFALEDIKAGEIIEEAPVLSQPTPFLSDYTFMSGDKYVLPLGNIALYNHSEDASCKHSLDTSGEVMTLTATKDIKAGSELSISYGPHWFSARGMQARSLDSEAV